MNNSDLNKLFVGKTITSAQFSGEGVKFETSDGNAFRFCMNDCGTWVEECGGANGYSSFSVLVNDFYTEEYPIKNHNAKINENAIKIELISTSGKSFIIEKDKLSDREKQIFNTNNTDTILEAIIGLGDMWIIAFP